MSSSAIHIGSVVVVGAGLAGLRTVERLRHRGYDGRIELLGAEKHLPYDRPPLSKAILRGEREEAWLRAENDFTALDVKVRLDDPALNLDTTRRVVSSRHGDLAYDVAVIATGAVARRVPGLRTQALRTMDDARQLRSSLRPGARLGIVGAGLIGCEVAASARSMGVEVELIDLLSGPMIRVVGTTVAHVIADLQRQHGARLHLNAVDVRWDGDCLVLGNGTKLDVDVVVEAIGAVPDTGWLRNSTIGLDDGVVCDLNGCAGPGVYAVGDVARWGGLRGEHWANAGHQADHVAAAILGQTVPQPEVAYWWSDQYNLRIQGLGRPDPEDDVDLISWGPKHRTVAVYSCVGRLTGVVGFSAAPAIMGLRGDVAAGTAVDRVLERLTS
jgi:3-phenylpropionate/trans-cinnamate dioxygenase ferredoxin reductase subunit